MRHAICTNGTRNSLKIYYKLGSGSWSLPDIREKYKNWDNSDPVRAGCADGHWGSQLGGLGAVLECRAVGSAARSGAGVQQQQQRVAYRPPGADCGPAHLWGHCVHARQAHSFPITTATTIARADLGAWDGWSSNKAWTPLLQVHYTVGLTNNQRQL